LSELKIRTFLFTLLGVSFLALILISCNNEPQKEAPQLSLEKKLSQASFEFSFQPFTPAETSNNEGEKIPALEIHFLGSGNTSTLVASLFADGRFDAGIGNEGNSSHQSYWIDPEIVKPLTLAPSSQSPEPALPEEAINETEAAPSLDTKEEATSTALGAIPEEPKFLGTISTDGRGDGWTKGLGGQGLEISRGELLHISGLDWELRSGIFKSLHISALAFDGSRREILSLDQMHPQGAQGLIEGLQSNDRGIFLELNGGDGYYSSDAGELAVYGLANPSVSADDSSTEGLQAEAINSPLPSLSVLPEELEETKPAGLEDPNLDQEASWHRLEIILEDQSLSFLCDGRLFFQIALDDWADIKLIPQRSPGPRFRDLKAQ